MDQDPDPACEDPGGCELAEHFAKIAAEKGIENPAKQHRPSALLPPHAAIAGQMEALLRINYPEENSGLVTAWKFALPLDAENMLQGGTNRFALSWSNVMQGDRKFKMWLTMKEFDQQVNSPAYKALLNATDWQPAWELIWNDAGDEVSQAVRVGVVVDGVKESRTFTFLMKKVAKGPYKDCWMTTGVHIGHIDMF
eukprot:CAMPEP_0198212332 /NCGR_PEP_ID=MMETSP1445-20131203/25656_1 /TAXON_ID=36898 /ORGANISM="Pyramimonas sp., Strain CCMP2087" /LENGTH=195 /DNA_ID=CAMNT_0043886751 /DNA_START=361 /DNA_END=948 /DNA_ORIENTATION=-